MSDPELPEPLVEHAHVDGAIMVSFGAVHPGREGLAVETFKQLSQYFGRQMDQGKLTAFKPYFFADGALGDMIGFFLLEGKRADLDGLRRSEGFVRQVLRAGAATHNVRVHTMQAGSEAGRLVNLYREVRAELGLL